MNDLSTLLTSATEAEAPTPTGCAFDHAARQIVSTRVVCRRQVQGTARGDLRRRIDVGQRRGVETNPDPAPSAPATVAFPSEAVRPMSLSCEFEVTETCPAALTSAPAATLATVLSL